MTTTSSFLEELLELKKQQATQLFGPWDVEDEGRIAVRQVRPLLLSVFPASSSLSSSGTTLTTTTAPYLTLSRVRAAYESVTHRPYNAPPSVATASSALHHARRPRDPMYVGPTLDELHRIIDVLASSADEVEDTSAAAPPVRLNQNSGKQSSTLVGAAVSEYSLSLSASWALRGATVEENVLKDVRGSTADDENMTAARLRLLRGSLEQIYQALCAGCVRAGEPVPSVLPTDVAHLKHLAWALRAQKAQLGESYALQRLFASVASSDEVEKARGGEDSNEVSFDAFVSLLCTL